MDVAVKLHRCANQWVKLGAHPCWRVEKALIDAGIDYERVPGPLRRSKRDGLEALSGQRQYPVIELEDGTVYREESADMAKRIREGRLESG
jgi:glutathione S-transferase